ncbi:MAG: NADH-quinone oxidoreductase subunit N [Syntrophobacteraceae bacterium]
MKWMAISPEILYLVATMGFLVRSLGGRSKHGREHGAALVLAGAGVLLSLAVVGSEGHLFAAAYRMDLFTQVFKVMLSAGLFLVVSLCGEMIDVREEARHDFYALLFVCTLAMMMLVSSDHLLAMYVSLELSSYSLYVLVALRKDQEMGLEAGIKYFVVGIFASAVMVFGLALLYGTVHSAYMPEITKNLPGMIGQPAVIFGLVLTLSGFLFKLAIFPFHHWAPDVYQGAMNQVSAYIATASKVAAIAVLIKLVAAAGQGSPYLTHVLVVLSIVSMTVGNLAAITQQDLKRLLAYSTVAHSGYVLLGILSMNRDGYAGAVFYALSLLIMKSTAFLVVVKVACDGKNPQLVDLAGLHRRSPLLALALMVSLFSLAGIPPTIGFAGKFLVFVAAMERGYFTLVLIAMINVVISLYYYLLVIKAAYLVEPAEEQSPIRLSPAMSLLTGGLIVAMVVGGFFPNPLVELALAASKALL